MLTIAAELAPLGRDARDRVLRWAATEITPDPLVRFATQAISAGLAPPPAPARERVTSARSSRGRGHRRWASDGDSRPGGSAGPSRPGWGEHRCPSRDQTRSGRSTRTTPRAWAQSTTHSRRLPAPACQPQETTVAAVRSGPETVILPAPSGSPAAEQEIARGRRLNSAVRTGRSATRGGDRGDEAAATAGWLGSAGRPGVPGSVAGFRAVPGRGPAGPGRPGGAGLPDHRIGRGDRRRLRDEPAAVADRRPAAVRAGRPAPPPHRHGRLPARSWRCPGWASRCCAGSCSR